MSPIQAVKVLVLWPWTWIVISSILGAHTIIQLEPWPTWISAWLAAGNPAP